MTREETKDILMVVQAAYPNFNPPDKTITIKTWWRFLEGYTYEQVNAAVGMYIRSNTNGFAPDIGKIIEKLQTLFEPEDLNEMAAWGMVLKAIRNSGYHAEEEFAKLPQAVQKAVVSPGQLREWALAEDVDGTWMNVTQSNFLRTYRTEVVKEKEMRKLGLEMRENARLPEEFKNLLASQRTETIKQFADQERPYAEDTDFEREEASPLADEERANPELVERILGNLRQSLGGRKQDTRENDQI